MTRSQFPISALSTRTTAGKSGTSTLKSPPVTTGPRALERRPKPDSISSPGSRTTPSCAASWIRRKSQRGSLHYENPSHPYSGAPIFRLHGRRSPLPLSCGHAFRLFHLPAVPPVHQDETRQAQRGLRAKDPREEAHQLEGIPPAWPRLSSFLTESL